MNKGTIMRFRYFLFPALVGLSSCQYLPEISKSIEDIETDQAIRVEVSREALQKDSNLNITIDLKNNHDNK
jgi:hypothetical protein